MIVNKQLASVADIRDGRAGTSCDDENAKHVTNHASICHWSLLLVLGERQMTIYQP